VTVTAGSADGAAAGFARPNRSAARIAPAAKAAADQANDRGLKELLLGAPTAPERLANMRAELGPLAAELVDRARAAGRLRADCEPEDLGIVHLMLSAVIDAADDVAPELWRRYFAILLQGLRADPAPPEPLPIPAVSPEQIDDVLMHIRKQRRA
jgi:hypothetical protein